MLGPMEMGGVCLRNVVIMMRDYQVEQGMSIFWGCRVGFSFHTPRALDLQARRRLLGLVLPSTVRQPGFEPRPAPIHCRSLLP